MLNHRVDIPYAEMKDHHIPASFDLDTLDIVLTSWMRENIEYEWNWQCEHVWPNRLPYIVFRFEKKEDAMVFKLRWG